MVVRLIVLCCFVYVALGATSENTEVYRCDFETDKCSLKSISSPEWSGTYWRRVRGTGMQSAESRIGDHTSRMPDGFFGVFTTNRCCEGSRADYIVPVELNGVFCLQFWYNILGRDARPPTVVTKRPSGDSQIIWTGETNITTQWIFANATIDIDQSNTSEVAFRAIRGKTNNTEIALDDISIISGGCESPWVPETDDTPNNASGSVVDIDRITCKFDSKDDTGICNKLCSGWTEIKDNKYLSHRYGWKKGSQSPRNGGRGPNSDHTPGKGSYLYLNKNPMGITWTLPEPLVTRFTYKFEKEACGLVFTMFYFIREAKLGKLAVTFREKVYQRVYELRENSLNTMSSQHWTQFSMTRNNPVTEIAIVGTLGNSDIGDIAIDDITITSSQCLSSVPLKTTRSTTPVSLPEPTFNSYPTPKESFTTNSVTMRYHHSTPTAPAVLSILSSTTLSYPLNDWSKKNSTVEYHAPNYNTITPNSPPPSSSSVYENFSTTESLDGTNLKIPTTPNIINNVSKLTNTTESALNSFQTEQDLRADVTSPAAIKEGTPWFVWVITGLVAVSLLFGLIIAYKFILQKKQRQWPPSRISLSQVLVLDATEG